MLLGISVVVFAVASMLSVGLGHTVREILGPLRHVHGVYRALLANFILVPLFAFGVVQMLPMDPSAGVGLLLISTAAGAPFLITLTEHAEHDLGLSTTLLVLLLPATALYMPAVVPLLIPDATVDAWSIAMPLLMTMLVPLGIGLFVREWSPAWARMFRPFLGRVSSIALLVLVATTFLVNLPGIIAILRTAAIIGVILVISGAFLIGYALGGHDPENRAVLGLATSQRNIAAATVVAVQGFHDPGILVMVITSSLLGLAMLFPIARVLRHRVARRTVIQTGNILKKER